MEYIQHLSQPNLGTVFVRYKYKRDAARAAVAMNNTELDGNIISVVQILPHFWPTTKSRRYY